MSYRIIVARYNEDITWTKQFSNVIIYNKGKVLNNGYNEVFLNNVGKEGHTYYKYIFDNYDTLEDYTIFLQGTPFDHSPNIIYNMHNYINYINKEELNIDFKFLSETIYYSSLKKECNAHLTCKHIYKCWELIFGINGININQECIFGGGAQFIVSKHKILKNTKEFYENIIKMLEYDINPSEGYVIERLHKYIFNSVDV